MLNGNRNTFFHLVQIHILHLRPLMWFVFAPQTEKTNSESCLLREESQMVLCKVDSVVSSGEMKESPQPCVACEHSGRHCGIFTCTLMATPGRWTQESSFVCEDVHNILGGNRALLCQRNFVIFHGHFGRTSCECYRN